MNDARELPEASLQALRRFARGLLRDRDRAEDLVQEAWLAVLEKRPRVASPFAWLSEAARRAAFGVQRSEARRGERERRAARPEAQPSAAEVSGQIELLQRLLAALDRIEEPYRSAVALRYLDDLPPRAIAKRLGQPVNTVRTHVRRGLARLRRELDPKDERGREELLAALAPFAGRAPWIALGPASSLSIGRGAGMLAGNKLVAAVIGIALVGAAWLALRGGTKEAEAELAVVGGSTAPPSTLESPGAPLPGKPELEPSAASTRSAPALAVERRTLVVRARLDGHPIPAAQVSLERGDGQPLTFTADEHGALELGAEFPQGARIEVWADGYMPRALRLDESRAAQREIVELDLAGELRVTVREEDGRPVRGAYVLVNPAEPETDAGSVAALWPDLFYLPEQRSSLPFSQLSATDARGEVVLSPFPCDRLLSVSVREVVPETTVAALIPSATRTLALEIHVVRHGCIRGRLVWEDGSPAVGPPSGAFVKALVGDEIELNRPVGIMPADGAFELCGLPLGWVRWQVQYNVEMEPILQRVDRLTSSALDVGPIRLTRPSLVEGRVFLTQARPETKYRLQTRFERDGRVVSTGVTSTDGRIWSSVPPGPCKLALYLPFGGLVLEQHLVVPCEPLAIDLDPYIAALELRRPPLQRSTRFELQLREVGSAATGEARRLTYRWDPAGGTSDDLVWSGSDFSVPFLLPGTFDVYLDTHVGGVRFLGRATLSAGKTTTLECGAVESASVSGRLRSTAGKPIPRARIGALMPGMRANSAIETRSDEQGGFVFEGLAAGRWLVYPQSLGADSPAVVSVELAPGQHASIDVQADEPATVSGRVLRDGAGLENVSVYLFPSATSTKTDGSGGYAFDDLFPGPYSVHVSVPQENAEFDRRVQDVVLEPGTPLVVDFELGGPRQIVVVRRHGLPFAELSGAWAVSTRGETGARSVPGRDDALEMALDPGPCLFLFCSATAPWVNGYRGTELFHSVYLPAVPATRELEVDIDGAMLVVDATGSDETLPLARLVRIGAIEHPRWAGASPALIYEDFAPGKRRFVDLPLGAELCLESSRYGQVETTLELTIDRLGERCVTWPPR